MQLFYYSHIIGAVVFMVFGAMHHTRTWTYAAAGLVIYGIDVAYRIFQTSLPVTVDVSSDASKNIISVRIPINVRFRMNTASHAPFLPNEHQPRRNEVSCLATKDEQRWRSCGRFPLARLSCWLWHAEERGVPGWRACVDQHPPAGHVRLPPLSITSTNVNPEWRGTMLLQCKVYDKWTQVCCSHELVPEPVTMLGKAIADLERTLFQLRTWSAI